MKRETEVAQVTGKEIIAALESSENVMSKIAEYCNDVKTLTSRMSDLYSMDRTNNIIFGAMGLKVTVIVELSGDEDIEPQQLFRAEIGAELSDKSKEEV